uniref:Uncharacterized protein n=1 Tax=Panagrolaimus sp. JU765 TaxID=591449 RepID=A0AC34Q8M3_9BILA
MLFLVFLWIFLESIDGKCDHSERGLSETCLSIKPVMFQLRGIILKENDEIHERFQRQSGLIDGGYDNTRPNPRKSTQNPVGFPIAIPISQKFNLTNPRFQKLRIPTTNSKKNKTRIGIRGPIRQPIRLKFQSKQQQGNQRSEKPGIVPPPEFNSRISKNVSFSPQKIDKFFSEFKIWNTIPKQNFCNTVLLSTKITFTTFKMFL